MTANLNPKSIAQFINLHAARTASGKPAHTTHTPTTQNFESLLGSYSEAAAKTSVETEIAKSPQPTVGGLWRKA